MWSHASATRLSISESAHQRKRSHKFRETINKNPFLAETPSVDFYCLPRWLSSPRGPIAVLCLFFLLCTAAIVKYRIDPALRLARIEAQEAERALADLDRAAAPKQSKSLWPLGKWSALPHSSPSSKSLPAASHTYRPDGLLELNSTVTKHPILDLIEKGERDWLALKQAQSKTFEQVLSEYKRRYKRNPPAGFDAWWDYTQMNAVLLPDEYDQIDKDLAPFRALDLQDLREKARAMQDREHTFTIVIKDGLVTVEGPFATIRRATDIADIIQRFAEDIPYPVNMTFIVDDAPAVLMQHESKARMLEVAEQGEHYGPSDFVAEDPSLQMSNYARACPADSALRLAEIGQPFTNLDLTVKSFIWNSVTANDICTHPELKQLHGHTQTVGTDPTPLVPLFSWAKMKTHSDILVTPLEQYWDSYVGHDPEWSRKKHNKLLWRGSTTGADFLKDRPWQMSQRARLHFMSKEQNGTKEVLWADEEGQAQLSRFDVGQMNELYLDTSFSGQPAQCDEETCEVMRQTIDFAGLQGLDDSYQYKYMIDVDGNAWSGRFHRLMSTKSLVLKSTIFPEWYADRLIPWYHYVPVKIDYSDLYDIMAFFAGTPDGRGSHDRLAQRLAENGRHWAKRYWRRVDMASYMFRLVLEWSRLMHHGEQVTDYVPTLSH